jgi:hypothetical protein
MAPGQPSPATLPPDASDEAVLELLDAWVDDLARGDYAAAFARTKHDAYYGWTPKLMARVIECYGHTEPVADGEHFAVTDRASARGRPHYRQVDREGALPPVVGRALCDLPLNGEWSDVTASFRLVRAADGLDVVLEEIHVF